jgi:hypothetical protein
MIVTGMVYPLLATIPWLAGIYYQSENLHFRNAILAAATFNGEWGLRQVFRIHYLWGVIPYWDYQDDATDCVIWKDVSWHPAFPSSGGLARVPTKDVAGDVSPSIATTVAAYGVNQWVWIGSYIPAVTV